MVKSSNNRPIYLTVRSLHVAFMSICAAILFSFASCISFAGGNHLMPPTADQDPRIQSLAIHVAGHRRLVHYQTWGNPDNPAIFVLHGSLSDLRGYQGLSALADDGFYVVMWDQRGNGLSERITEKEYTEASIVEEIDAIIDSFAPKQPKVRLIGHSFGAMYAALYLSERPERIIQAVLIEPGGLTGRIFTDTYSRSININLFDPKLNSLFWQSEQLAPYDHDSADYRALMILQNGKQTNYHKDPNNPTKWPVWRPGGWVDVWRTRILGWDIRTNTYDFNFARGASSYLGTVLFMGGNYSALGADFQREFNAPLFSNAKVVEIAGTGHRLIVEDLQAVLGALRTYFCNP